MEATKMLSNHIVGIKLDELISLLTLNITITITIIITVITVIDTIFLTIINKLLNSNQL